MTHHRLAHFVLPALVLVFGASAGRYIENSQRGARLHGAQIGLVERKSIIYVTADRRPNSSLSFHPNGSGRGIEAFVPHAELRPLLLQGFACAWELGRYGEVLRLILLDFELGQRSSATRNVPPQTAIQKKIVESMGQHS
jgi:hypothetical protein